MTWSAAGRRSSVGVGGGPLIATPPPPANEPGRTTHYAPTLQPDCRIASSLDHGAGLTFAGIT